MPTVVSKAIGGRALPVGLLYVDPAQVAPTSGAPGLADAGVDPVFVTDLLSACLAHERCGLHLYRSVAGRTLDSELRSRYEEFGAETLEHVTILEELVIGAGGDPMYVSPAARATEKAGAGLVESTFLLAESVDPLTRELAMLEAVMLAEAKDHGNWELLAQVAMQMLESDARSELEAAVDRVLVQEEEHYGWARETRTSMLLVLATGSAVPSAVESADGTDMTRDELYAQAQELEIERRSTMTKDELAQAISEHTGAQR
jgi:rubrerythrin